MCHVMQSSADDSGITPVEALPSLSHDRDSLAEGSLSLPAIRTSRVSRPGRAHMSGSLPTRAQAPSQSVQPLLESADDDSSEP